MFHNIITLLYLIICFISHKNKNNIIKINKNYIKYFSIIHYCGLVICNFYITITILYIIVKNNYKFYNNNYKIINYDMNNILWLYWISKYYNYIETILIILKHNYYQLSYLHIFHHSSISTITVLNYILTPYGGDIWFLVIYNSIIHILLNYYYLLLIFNKKLWFIKYFTLIQIIQFILCLIQQLLSRLYNKEYPLYIRELNIIYIIYMLYLFINFYIKKYKKII